ncbi:MAG TPA: protein kinase, partial [Kofleriaceae bacterium]
VADDPQLERKVALKIVRAARFGGEARTRLSREARAMAQVKHPHVVTVYDAGELDDGVFIAMELIDGATLAEWLRAGRPWRELIRMFDAAGRGLAAAHAAGIVHRDFKPENVLVDRGERAVVTDFGLAFAPAVSVAVGTSSEAVAGVALREAGALTRTGALLGTPLYMSPEQHRGERVDARSDQYSFAVALYMALYGAAPFAGGTIGELRASVLSGGAVGRPAGSAVPPRVHRVLARALATDPEARYPSMTVLLDELAVAARPLRWRRLGALGGGLLAVLAAIGAAWGVRSAPPERVAPAPVAMGSAPTPAARRLAVMIERFDNASGDARLDGAAELQLVAELARSTRLDAMAGLELAQRKLELGVGDGPTDDAGRALTARDGKPALVIAGTIARQGRGLAIAISGRDPAGRVRPFGLRAEVATADQVLPAVAELAREVRGQLGDPVAGEAAHAMTTSLDAVHALNEGQKASFAGQGERAYALFQRAVNADPHFALAHVQLGNTLYNLERIPEASRELERALAERASMSERMRLHVLADYLDVTGRYLESVAASEQLLAKWPGDTRTEINVVSTALNGASWPLALELARRAAANHGNVAVVRGNLVIAELANNLIGDAARDGALALRELPHPSPFGAAATAIAQVLHGELAAGEQTIERLRGLDSWLAQTSLADLRVLQGRLADAEALYRKQLDEVRTLHNEQEPRFPLASLAQIQLRRGEPAAARKTALQAVGLETPRNAYMVASLLCETGDDHVARELARTWADSALPETRMLGKLLDGDLARQRRDWRAAIAAYTAAGKLLDLWPVHARLGLALLAAGQPAEAARELAAAVARRGEAAVFLTPSLAYLPEVYLGLARARDAAHDPAAAEAYRAVVDLAPAADAADLFTATARRRLAALAAQ